jgi:hypothetical protein
MGQDKQTQIMSQGQEGLTGFQASISSDHAYIHDGIAFTAIIEVTDVASAYDIAFTTPSVSSGKFIHWRPIGITSSANYVDIKLREGDTFSAGSAVTPINRNRLATNTTNMQTMVTNATATPAGTVIQQTGIGTSGNPVAVSGGGAGAEQELVLAQDTNYVITITPDDTTTVVLSLFWYEENKGIDS